MLPREKLELYGPKALSSEELIAVLLRTGVRDCSVFELSSKLLRDHGQSLYQIQKRSLTELAGYKGMGKVKSITIQAALELGIRLFREIVTQKVSLRSAGDVYNLCADMLFFEQEVVRVIALNTKSMVVGVDDVTVGISNASLIHPREVFHRAISHSATSIILVHNHPSGDPVPSPQDHDITRRIKDSGEILGIALTDHIIIGQSRYYSFMTGSVYEEEEVQWDG